MKWPHGSSRPDHTTIQGNLYPRKHSKAASFLSQDLGNIEMNRPASEDLLLTSGKIGVRLAFPRLWNDTAQHFFSLAEDKRFTAAKRRLDLARKLLSDFPNCHALHVTHCRCNEEGKSTVQHLHASTARLMPTPPASRPMPEYRRVIPSLALGSARSASARCAQGLFWGRYLVPPQ